MPQYGFRKKYLFKFITVFSAFFLFSYEANLKAIPISFHYPQDTVNLNKLDGISLWLIADDIKGQQNDFISKWSNRVDSNHSPVQIDVNRQPILIDSALNGHKAVRFARGRDLLIIDSLDIKQPFTAFVVFKSKKIGVPGYIFTKPNFDKNALLISDGRVGFINGGQYYKSNGNTYNNNKFLLSKVFFNGNQSFLRVNDLDIVSGNISNGSGNILLIGGLDLYDGYSLDGDVAELIIFNRKLTSAEDSLIENYLNAKYAPPVSLGVNIIQTDSVCEKVIKPNRNFQSYRWSTGDTTASISVNKSGDYWLEATNIFGFKSRDTVHVQFPAYEFNQPTTLCKNDSVKWNVPLPKAGFGFLWSTGSTDSVITIHQPGKYVLQITDSVGCSLADSVIIQGDNFASITTLGADTSLCAGNSISLKNIQSPITKYQWLDGTQNAALKIDTAGTYWLTATNANGCILKDTVLVAIKGVAPVVDFTSSVTCAGKSMIFSDLSHPAVTSDTLINWQWKFGTSGFSTVKNPIYSFATPGNYTIQLKVATDKGCSQTLNKTIQVHDYPVANFNFTTACERQQVGFQDLTLAPVGDSINYWSWNFSDGTAVSSGDSLKQLIHRFVQSGIYSVNLISTTDKGCSDTISKSVVVKLSPKADFIQDQACIQTLTEFQDKSTFASGISPTAYAWFTNNGLEDFSKNARFTFLDTLSKQLMHVVTANNGCKDTLVKQIRIRPLPKLNFVTKGICTERPIVMDATSTQGATAYKWYLNNQLVSVQMKDTLNQVTSDSLNLSLVAQSGYGCLDTLTKKSVLYPIAKPAFAVSETFGNIPFEVQFSNSSKDAVAYQWYFGDNAVSTQISPKHTYLDSGFFQVRLLAKGQNGCDSSVSKQLEVRPDFLDAAIQQVSFDYADGFVRPHVAFSNVGSTLLKSVDIVAYVAGSTALKENWTGRLMPGGVVSYPFNGSLYVVDSTNAQVCISLSAANSRTDKVSENNRLCIPLKLNDYYLPLAYPNPTQNWINLSLVMPEAGLYSVEVLDLVGRVAWNESRLGVRGLNTVLLNTDNLTPGVYVYRYTVGAKVLIGKFTVVE